MQNTTFKTNPKVHLNFDFFGDFVLLQKITFAKKKNFNFSLPPSPNKKSSRESDFSRKTSYTFKTNPKCYFYEENKFLTCFPSHQLPPPPTLTLAESDFSRITSYLPLHHTPPPHNYDIFEFGCI
jgi:hypothetical protein